MHTDLNDAVRRVREALEQGAYGARLVTFEASARSAVEAAAAIGCEVAQIAKSIVFQGAESGLPVLVVASGINRVDETLVAALIGEPLARAGADWVREQTGFVIGGVAPIAHAREVRSVVDEDLMAHATVWAAAGHPRVVFEVDPRELPRMAGGAVGRVRAG